MNWNPDKEGEEKIHKTMCDHTRETREYMERRERDQRLRDRCAFLIIIGATLLIWILASGCADAEEIPEQKLLHCVIGEAANQGVEGMEAVCRGIMNRGTTKGVYGCKSSMPDTQPEWVWSKARTACEMAEGRDIIQGADHWENVQAFGKPYWADSMVKTVKIRDHQFYRAVR